MWIFADYARFLRCLAYKEPAPGKRVRMGDQMLSDETVNRNCEIVARSIDILAHDADFDLAVYFLDMALMEMADILKRRNSNGRKEQK